MKKTGYLLGKGIDRALKKKVQFIFLIVRQGEKIVDVFHFSLPQQQGGHLIVAGIGLSDKAFLQIVLAAGGRMSCYQQILIAAKEIYRRLIIDYIVRGNDEISQLKPLFAIQRPEKALQLGIVHRLSRPELRFHLPDCLLEWPGCFPYD